MPIYSLFQYFCANISNILEQYFGNQAKPTEYVSLEEIRLRTTRPLILKFSESELALDYIVSTEDILETLQNICENSIYSYQNQICSGFITIRGGHRVGIAGNIVMEKNQIINVNYISSLNFRIAKQIKGCSNKILKYILDMENNTVFNTLIVSEPGAGKTTILRDTVRRISGGIENINFKGITVGLVDERGEIAAMYKNEPQNDMGLKVDILSNVSKDIGIRMLVRSMAPDIICADEIGTKNDVEAIKYAVTSGVKGIFTAHGNNIESIKNSPILKELIEIKLIDRIIFLDKYNRNKIIIEDLK